jgi:WD40 repeat protein
LAALRGHEEFVSYLAWSPVDERLLSSGADGNVHIWNTDQNHMIISLPYGDISEGEWSPNGNEFLVSSDVIAVWDVQKMAPIMETSLGKDPGWLWVAFYSPNGDYILARTVLGWGDTTDANKFWLLDSQTGEILRMFETDQDDILLEAGWSPDGKLVAAGDWEGNLYFWDSDTGQRIKEMQCLSWAHMVRWSPDGSRIAALCLDFEAGITQIRIFDAENYQNLITFEGNLDSDPYQYFSWSPDSNRIVVAGGTDEIGTKENPVYVFDAITGDELLKIIRHIGHVWGVNWSPNGERIVSGSTDDTTRVWDAETGAELLTLSTPTDWGSLPAWSPDGQYLLTTLSVTEMETISGVWRVWQTTEDLIKYAKECCAFRELTPKEREQFGLPPNE